MSTTMSISGVSSGEFPGPYEIKTLKLAQDQAKLEGEQAVSLIEQAAPAAPRADGTGQLVDTIA